MGLTDSNAATINFSLSDLPSISLIGSNISKNPYSGSLGVSAPQLYSATSWSELIKKPVSTPLNIVFDIERQDFVSDKQVIKK